jgi:hypothetical protein
MTSSPSAPVQPPEEDTPAEADPARSQADRDAVQSGLSFLIIGVLLAAYEVGLQQIKPPTPGEAPPTSGPNGQVGLSSPISET